MSGFRRDPIAEGLAWVERTLAEEIPWQHPREREALAGGLHVTARDLDVPVDWLVLWLHESVPFDADWHHVLLAWREECGRYRARLDNPAS